MSLFAERDLSFFQFLTDASDNQLKSTLTYLSPGQYVLLKRAAESIVEELIPITAREFQALAADGSFIERLADGPRIRSTTLVKKRKPLVRLAHIAVKYYEEQSESRSRPESRLGSYESARQPQNGQGSGHCSKNAEIEKEEGQDRRRRNGSASTSNTQSASSSEEDEEEEEEEEY